MISKPPLEMISGSVANSAARAANGRPQVSANCHCLRRQGETMGMSGVNQKS